jgi:hypothetical protein
MPPSVSKHREESYDDVPSNPMQISRTRPGVYRHSNLRDHRIAAFDQPRGDAARMSSKNSDPGSTLVISKWSRARVQAT